MAVTKSPLRSCRAVITDGEGKVQYERNPASESIAAMAEATGSDPMALIYDALVSEKVLWAPLGRNPNQDMPIDMLKHPNVKVGLGDGGAHLGVFQEASCPTFMLTHYVRDRNGERIPLEEAVKLQTSDTAHLLGLKDRGVIAEGLRADINIIDHGEPGRLQTTLLPGLRYNDRAVLQRISSSIRLSWPTTCPPRRADGCRLRTATV